MPNFTVSPLVLLAPTQTSVAGALELVRVPEIEALPEAFEGEGEIASKTSPATRVVAIARTNEFKPDLPSSHPKSRTTTDYSRCRLSRVSKVASQTGLVGSERIAYGVYFWTCVLSGRLDLNQRPLRPKRSALPGCATPRRPTILNQRPCERRQAWKASRVVNFGV